MPKVTCPNCEFVNPDGQTACVKCSTPLPRVDRAAPPQGGARPASGDAAQWTFRPGQVIAARYSVLGMIGRGGMGCIYRVRDNALKEEVALKTLLPQFVRDKMVVERFFNEARIARGLAHPNIVRVHDIGITGNTIFISMELVRGRSLRAMLEELPPGQRLPMRTTLHVIDELCAALEYAHRHTVHRDIKPENVMVDQDGTVKLMDFGISKLMDTTRLTGPSIVMGTPFYMAPEQLRNSANVDGRADIYSVGVLLYEILTGNVPTGVPKPASQITREVPPALDPIVAKCVDPEPNNRYQTTTELRKALRHIIELVESGSLVEDAGTRKRAGLHAPWMRKALGGSLIGLILVAMAGGLYASGKATPPNAPPGKPDDTRARGGPAGTDDAQEAFNRIERRITQFASQIPPETERTEDMKRVLEEASAKWESAKTQMSLHDPKGLALAHQAVQCYYVLQRPWPQNMVFVPPGDVTLRDVDGVTTNVVTLDGFFIDATEVTNAEYLQFCSAVEGGWRRPPYDLESAPPNKPVVWVTFYDAEAYAAWAKKKLPTEAQWGRAAYGQNSASEKYPWGDDWVAGYCNSGTREDREEFMADVATFGKDRAWCGCSDMAGNVAEWTRSVFSPIPYHKDDGREDPARIYFGVKVAVRGGHFRDTTRTPLNARNACPFESAADTLGFRCVLELPSNIEDTDKRP